MSDTKYAYAVARIRALENGLFSSAQIEQLLSVKSYEGALRFLTEHGWGDADTPLSAEAILTREKTKTWETVRDLLKGDDAILAVLSYGDLYHNLKAAIKDAAAPGSHGNVYFDDCEVDGVWMAKIVAEKDWQALPAHMREAAKEASETFLHTSDGSSAISSLTGRRLQLSMSAERMRPTRSSAIMPRRRSRWRISR